MARAKELLELEEEESVDLAPVTTERVPTRGETPREAQLRQQRDAASARVLEARKRADAEDTIRKNVKSPARSSEMKANMTRPLEEQAKRARDAGWPELAESYELAAKAVDAAVISPSEYDVEEATWTLARHLDPYQREVLGRGAVNAMVDATEKAAATLQGLAVVTPHVAREKVIPGQVPAQLDPATVTLTIETLRMRVTGTNSKERADSAGRVAAEFGPESLEARLLLSNGYGAALVGDDRVAGESFSAQAPMDRALEEYIRALSLQDNKWGECLRIGETAAQLSTMASMIGDVAKRSRRKGEAVDPASVGVTLYGSKVAVS